MSALDALSPEELAELYELRTYRALERIIAAELLKEHLRRLLHRVITPANPAAGVDPTAVVPPGATWEVVSFTSTITCSATVANRTPGFVVKDQDGNILYRLPGNFTETANGSDRWSWVAGLGDHVAAGGVAQSIPTPQPVANVGWTVGVVTPALQAGDQWSSTFVTVVEYTPQRIVRACEMLLRDIDSAGGLY